MTPTNADLTHVYAYGYDLQTSVVEETRIKLELAELGVVASDDATDMSEWVEAEQKEAELLTLDDPHFIYDYDMLPM